MIKAKGGGMNDDEVGIEMKSITDKRPPHLIQQYEINEMMRAEIESSKQNEITRLEEVERGKMKKAEKETLDYINEETLNFLKTTKWTFGEKLEKIKKFFENFDLLYATDTVKRIGGESKNGFVKEITFTKNGYSASAVLKSSFTATADTVPDNLMYEYRVGLFLNKMSLLYPCFLETYNLYSYESQDYQTTVESVFQKNNTIDSEVLKGYLRPQNYNLKFACTNPTQTCILIQHLKNAVSAYDFVASGNVNLIYDVLTMLYQIYFVLNAMKDIFTHYDLHTGNVLLYEPSPDKYVHYHYKHGDSIRSFKSIYVVKIIDYGRCYFKDTNESSYDIRKALCAETACEPNCGENVGFDWLKNNNDYNTPYFINSSILNNSHDLKFVRFLLWQMAENPKIDKYAMEVLSSTFSKIIYDQAHGTRSLDVCDTKICNVTTMFNELERIIGHVDLDKEFDKYYKNRTKLGDMYVYDDKRPLEFIEV